MKKALLFIALFGSINFVMAQSVNFGLKGGINFSSLSASFGGSTVTTSNASGFHVGAVVDVGLGDWSLQPGLLYSTKGVSNGTFNYLEVPVNLLYNFKIPEAGKFFLGAGPYAAYGISGSNGITFGGGVNDVGNPDFGLNFLVGVRFKDGLMFSANYGLGLTNLNNDTSTADININNKVISISIGYFFK